MSVRNYRDTADSYQSMALWNQDKEKRSWLEFTLTEAVKQSDFKMVVLDDDPTGVQTVHDISVFTDWSEECIEEGFLEKNKLFYLLTNSRGLTESETTEIHIEIARRISAVSKKLGIPFLIISRSDSTLRGHYPLETQVLRQELEKETEALIDGEILIPFFRAGGRLTVENIHYVRYENDLIPAGETEFAKDKTFGYAHSDLTEYIEEKTKGEYKAEQVTAITLAELRAMDIKGITRKLMGVHDFNKIIVNALEIEDLKVFAISLYEALAAGKHFLFRTAADFVKVVGDITEQPLLTKSKMMKEHSSQGGMIVVGSHTQKTTAQLNSLRGIPGLEFLELNTDLVLDGTLEKETMQVTRTCEELINKGVTPVVYTKRTLLIRDQDTKEMALIRSVKISDAVQRLVGELKVEPSFIIAKGGITSSDIGVKALKVKKALVLGQVQPGIPVWKTDEQSRFPGIPYVIFPGNVGSDESLKNVVLELLS